MPEKIHLGTILEWSHILELHPDLFLENLHI